MQASLDKKRRQLLLLYAVALGQIQLDTDLTPLQRQQARTKAKQMIHTYYQQYLTRLTKECIYL